MPLPNLQSYNFQIRVGLGLTSQVSFAEPSTSQAAASYKTAVTVNLSTNNFPINLATLFPALTAAQVVNIREVANALAGVGFNISDNATGPGINIRPNSAIAFGAGLLQTLYVSNTSTTTALVLEIEVVGS